MKAAQKTIDFAKEWVAGTYTKRQYQNYYTVKTPYAQFLLKLTNDRELMAIKDNTGHIYLFHAPLPLGTDLGGHKIVDIDDRCMSNPFLCLIAEGFQFEHTSVHVGFMTKDYLRANISQWKTLDRVEIKNESLPMPVYLSLVDIGGKLYYLYPDALAQTGTNDKEVSLQGWIDNVEERQFKFPHKWPIYAFDALQSNTIKKVNEIKESYLTIAGNKAEESLVKTSTNTRSGYRSANGWVVIPTDFKTVEEITGRSFREAKKARPNFYNYGLPAHLVSIHKIQSRFETMEENALSLPEYITIRQDILSMSWRGALRAEYYPELAEAFISFFEADDAWLREHFEIVQAERREALARQQSLLDLHGATVYIHKEPNSSVIGNYVIYIKTQKNNITFTKILPAPLMACKVDEAFNVGD